MCGSRRLKFINLMSNLNVKKLRHSIFVLDEALLNLATGVTLSVMTEPNLKVTKYRTKRQAAKAACLKVRLFNKSVKVSQHPTHCARAKHADKARDDEAMVDDVFTDVRST